MGLTLKEKIMCVIVSIALNITLVYLYGKFIKPRIDEASKGMVIMMLEQARQRNGH